MLKWVAVLTDSEAKAYGFPTAGHVEKAVKKYPPRRAIPGVWSFYVAYRAQLLYLLAIRTK